MLVILAIIALIITPIVTNLIKDSRIKAAENAIVGLLDAVDVYYGRQTLNGNGTFNNNQTQTVEFDGQTGGTAGNVVDGDTAIEFNGFKVTGGTLTIDRYGKVQISTTDQLRINGYYCLNSGKKVKCDEEAVDPDDIGVTETGNTDNNNDNDDTPTSGTATATLTKLEITSAVTEGDGLYADGDSYVFKGQNPANYIILHVSPLNVI